tara:strand:+ start:1036 stop:1968 length:933 start_codon:yes stop_codon:yes gene_type:complete
MKYYTCNSRLIDVEVDSPEELFELAFAHETLLDNKVRHFYAPEFAKGWDFVKMRKHCKSMAADMLRSGDQWLQGITSRSKAEDLLCNPPSWMVDRAHECLDKIEAAVANAHLADAPRRRRRRNLEDGDTIMMERAMLRHPEPWERTERVPTASKVVRIMVNQSTGANMDRNTLVYRGAAAVAAAMEIERRGGKCEIYATTCNTNTKSGFGCDRLSMTTLVKPVNEPTTISRTLAVCSHIGIYRAVVLNARQTVARSSCESHGYGLRENVYGHIRDRYQPDVIIDQGDVTLTRACGAVSRAIESFDRKDAA